MTASSPSHNVPRSRFDNFLSQDHALDVPVNQWLYLLWMKINIPLYSLLCIPVCCILQVGCSSSITCIHLWTWALPALLSASQATERSETPKYYLPINPSGPQKSIPNQMANSEQLFSAECRQSGNRAALQGPSLY